MISCELGGKKYTMDFVTGRALREIDDKCEVKKQPARTAACILPKKRCTIGEAIKASGEMCDIYAAEGKVSREYLRAYPPGVPLIVPGEVIDGELLNQLRFLEACDNEILTDSASYPFISIIG